MYRAFKKNEIVFVMYILYTVLSVLHAGYGDRTEVTTPELRRVEDDLQRQTRQELHEPHAEEAPLKYLLLKLLRHPVDQLPKDAYTDAHL